MEEEEKSELMSGEGDVTLVVLSLWEIDNSEIPYKSYVRAHRFGRSIFRNLDRIFEWCFFTFRFIFSKICQDVQNTVSYDTVFLTECLPGRYAAPWILGRFCFLPGVFKCPGRFIK
jgi:hypothetical protein